jgi:hypothetical protein
MKALHIALISGAVSLFLAACSAGGSLPNTPPQTLLQIHRLDNSRIANHAHHARKGVHYADCPVDSGGINPGAQTC